MVVVPIGEAVLSNLNSYYIEIRRLLEHCQGELGSGGIHLKSPSAEGIVYFDKDEVINGVFHEKEQEFAGPDIMERLIEATGERNFVVDIYRLSSEEVYYWANMPAAQRIHSDLSAEFTDLEGLIKKMSSEGLTGFIDARIGDGRETGIIFFNNGKILGGSYSWANGVLNHSKENQDLLISKIKESGAVFHVSRISLNHNGRRLRSEKERRPAPAHSDKTLAALEHFLRVAERVFNRRKSARADFQTLLKRKFIESVDRYAFLDPFAAEFSYEEGKVSFSGEATDRDLVVGVMESVAGLAKECGVQKPLKQELTSWSARYAKELEKLGVPFDGS